MGQCGNVLFVIDRIPGFSLDRRQGFYQQMKLVLKQQEERKEEEEYKNKESPNHKNDSVNLVTMTYQIAQVYTFESSKQQPRPCSEFEDWHINFDAENIYSKRQILFRSIKRERKKEKKKIEKKEPLQKTILSSDFEKDSSIL